MNENFPIYESLDQEKRTLLREHLEMVIEANERVNLTRIENLDEGMLLHIEDSLSGLEEMNAAPKGSYADMGSGAGFPGIPLAIATGRKTTLIDSRKRKMDEVSVMIEKLGYSSSIDVFPGRAELLARKKPAEYSVITARALSKISVLLELSSPLLKMNGRLICYKANVEDGELEHAMDVEKKTGMKLLSDRSFTLGSEYTRRVIVFEKTSRPTMKLPRLEGQAQKNPL